MMIKQFKLTGTLFLAGVFLAVAYAAVGPRTHAAALHGSVIVSTGKFDSSGAMTGYSVPSNSAGVYGAASFEAWVKNLLNHATWCSSSGECTPGSAYNAYGAAFLVETMIHGQVNFAANDALVTQAKADFNFWAGEVNSYASAGKIQWSVASTLPTGSLNSLHVCSDPNGYCWAKAVYENNNYNGGGYDAHKFQFYNISSPEPSHLIIFTNPDGTTFQIRRECANVIGSAHPLKASWQMSGHTTVNNSSPYPGQSITFSHYVKDNGPGNTNQNIWWAILDDKGATVQGGQDSGAYNAGQEKLVGTKTVSIPGNTAGGTKICEKVLYDWANSSGGRNGTGALVCATVQNITPSCGSATTNPGTFDPTDPFAINAYVNIAGGSAGAAYVNAQSDFFIRVTEDATGNTIYDNENITPTAVGNGTISVAQNLPPTNKAGNYTIAYGITGSVSPKECPGSFRVMYTPYFKVSGGDVAAGPDFGTACTPELSSILGNNLGSSAGYFGAATQLGAFSLNKITGFASNTTLSSSGTGDHTASSAAQPSGLAFSNTGASNTVWGTSYGKDATEDSADNANFCVPDYYAAATNATPAPTVLSNGDKFVDQSVIDSLTSGKTYVINGDLQTGGDGVGNLFLGGTHPGRITLVVNGNAYINSHIRYAPYNYASGTTSIDSIPQFQLIVKGNIFVDLGVTWLSGFYAAQPDGGSGGNIYTCARTGAHKYVTGDSTDTSSSAQYESDYYSACGNPLTVSGSLAAKNVKLLRTGGNWKKTPSVDNTPAEQIIYPPELWMGSLNNTSGGAQPFDAITNLPPIL